MNELSVVVNLARKVGITLVGRLEDYLLELSDWPKRCVAIVLELMRTLEPLVSL